MIEEANFAGLVVEPDLIAAATGVPIAIISPAFRGDDDPSEGEIGIIDDTLRSPRIRQAASGSLGGLEVGEMLGGLLM